MKFSDHWSGRRLSLSILSLVSACWLVLPSPLQAGKFWAASWGAISIYTSDSPENTEKFLGELLEVRRQVQDLAGPVPLPNPRMQVVILSKQKDYDDFVPARMVTDDMRTVAGFFPNDYGLTVSLVKGGGYRASRFARDVVLFYYAQYLIECAVPDAPFWVRIGLPELLAATECRDNRMHIGGDFMEHKGHVRASTLIPLAELMNDEQMRSYVNAPRHDNVLYHESWALWQQWLTAPDSRRREQIRRYFAALQNGAPGGLDQVAESFGETKAAIEAAHRTRKGKSAFAVVVSNPEAKELTKGLVFQPATELDGRFAQAMLFARAGKGLGAFGYEFRQYAEADPASPRAMEAQAVLAMGTHDTEGAALLWEQARERGTDNAYAYLLPAQQALENNRYYFTLQPQLFDPIVTKLRNWLERCVQLDPGCVEAHYYRSVLEAFAPQPDKAAVDAIERSNAAVLRPMGFLYLAVARWRLGEFEEAHRLLGRLQGRANLSDATKRSVIRLEETMRAEEKKASPTPG